MWWLFIGCLFLGCWGWVVWLVLGGKFLGFVVVCVAALGGWLWLILFGVIVVVINSVVLN